MISITQIRSYPYRAPTELYVAIPPASFLAALATGPGPRMHSQYRRPGGGRESRRRGTPRPRIWSRRLDRSCRPKYRSSSDSPAGAIPVGGWKGLMREDATPEEGAELGCG